jgi:hypothetical protein
MEATTPRTPRTRSAARKEAAALQAEATTQQAEAGAPSQQEEAGAARGLLLPFT